MSMQSRPSTVSRLLAPVIAAIRKMRTIALATALVASVVVLGVLSWRIHEVRRDNAIIAALRNGDDMAVDVRKASGEVLLARSHFLLKRDRWEEAQSLLDSSSAIVDPKLRARLLYNHANARIREAIAAVGRSNLDKAIPLTRLAKDEYRLALRLDPTAWDIKFNYDVAMRIVRDFPGYDQESDDVPPDAPKRLWTDLPGVPKGLP
jgi:mxaK protein